MFSSEAVHQLLQREDDRADILKTARELLYSPTSEESKLVADDLFRAMLVASIELMQAHEDAPGLYLAEAMGLRLLQINRNDTFPSPGITPEEMAELPSVLERERSNMFAKYPNTNFTSSPLFRAIDEAFTIACLMGNVDVVMRLSVCLQYVSAKMVGHTERVKSDPAMS